MNRTLDLNGVWQLRWTDFQRGGLTARLLKPDADMARALPAQVPGEVHLDLMRAGLIEEPTVGLNALSARWVEETAWQYRRTFRAPRLAANARAWLVFERLELAAKIFLNGREIGAHANAFYPCRIEVGADLRPGENVLVVEIEAGPRSVAEKPVHDYAGRENTITKRHWLRTVQSQFGWDWALQLLNVGLTGGVRLEIASGTRVDGATVLASLSANLRDGQVETRLFVEGLSAKPQRGVLTVAVRAPSGAVVARTRERLAVKPGLQRLTARTAVAAPALWWPVGHGRQPRYTVEAVLTVAGRRTAAVTRRVGFRHVRVNQDPHPAGGQFFVIEVNGKPIFVKGGNFVPADPIAARLDRRRYAALVDRALEANFNLLRVWGGGLYESDDFYDLCDARGVLVWQEFIFACARYPSTDETFTASVRAEAAYQIRRLSHHASLVVWCGNNEIEAGYYGWGYDRTGAIMPDHALYHNVLPRVLLDEDPTRYYQPSSPFSPGSRDPADNLSGDQHPWSLGFHDADFRKYREMVCRFPNEGGILGPTALPTVRSCLPAGQQRPGSFAWEQHDNSVAYWGDGPRWPDRMLEQWLGLKTDGLTLEAYVYWAGVVQGQGLEEYIRAFRRRMFDCAAAVFWMYNDCWPMVRSWTIVDYALRRTPAFHPVRRAFLPLRVAVACEDGRVNVYGINEGQAWRGQVHFGLCRLAGGYPVDEWLPVELPANGVARLASFDAAVWKRRGETTHVAFARLLDEAGSECGRDVLIQPLYREMRWPRARVRVRLAQGKAVFTSDVFAWRVCLDLDGEASLPDNFFDVLPGIPTVLGWPARLGTPRVLKVGNAL